MTRIRDERIAHLYQKACEYPDLPVLWEGQFRLACLLQNAPAEEPVVQRIRDAVRDTETGEFDGSLPTQINIARAALSLFEYDPDRAVLKRLASWCRYLEIEWESLFADGEVIYHPADLMDFLVRFYRISGTGSVLRLCARLRSASFDWTTALQTFQQSIPLSPETTVTLSSVFSTKAEELDFDAKQFLINHAEMLADGFRFSLCAGLFSGNSQDLTAGKTAWNYIGRHHRAACGGTTGNPLLGGSSPAKPVNNRALAAWVEAFGAQLSMQESGWALEEFVRLVFNGLSECLSGDCLSDAQYVNRVTDRDTECPDMLGLLARLARAAATACQNAVMLSEQGIRINYLLPGRTIVRIQGKTVRIDMDGEGIIFHTDTPLRFPVAVGCTGTETADISVRHGTEERTVHTGAGPRPADGYILLDETWNDRDGIRFIGNFLVRTEETHHQGRCFFAGNRLLSADVSDGNYDYAVCRKPEATAEGICVQAVRAAGWHERNGNPADIPVLPRGEGEPVLLKLTPYDRTGKRITVFPRASEACSV